MVEQERQSIGECMKNNNRNYKVGIGMGIRCDKKIGKKRKIKRGSKRINRLQELFYACRNTFTGCPGVVPPPQDVQKLCFILDKMEPEDLGLRRDHRFFIPDNTTIGNSRIKCTIIYKCNYFSLCLFFLPSGGVIPLHNHPEMTVFSKLLIGTMHIKSFDWVDDAVHSSNGSTPSSNARLAKLKADNQFRAPSDTSVLYPTTGGNIHAFTAITPCAVLDVLGPPYSKDDGRDCSYYKEFPFASALPQDQKAKPEVEGESYSWLEEIEMEDPRMDVIEYCGPEIVETSW